MTPARLRCTVLVMITMMFALSACASGQQTPMVSNPPAPPAPTRIPSGWVASPVTVPGEAGAATYLAPEHPQRLRAALILSAHDAAGRAAGDALALMLAGQGVASLRFDGDPATPLDYRAALERSGQALTTLAQRSGVGDDRLLIVGHGPAASVTIALGAGQTGRAQMPIALIEPTLGALPAGSPDPLTAALALPTQKHNFLTCSDTDAAVDCSAVQSLADVLTGTHMNFVRLRGVNHALQDDPSTEPSGYAAGKPVSADLYRSLGSWIAMQ